MLKYLSFSLKRDKFFILFWLIALISLSVIVAPAFDELFATAADRAFMAETMKNPAMIALCGPAYDYSNYTNGVMMAQMMLVWMAAFAAIMNIFFVDRHTRKDEEEGRLELIRSLPIGKLAPITSTMLIAFFMNLLLALGSGILVGMMGIDSMSMSSSILYGVSIGLCGFTFAAITAISAQLFSTSRGVVGISVGILGLAYIIRAVGDIGYEWLSMISPLGIVCRTEVFVNDYWWPIFALFAASILLLIVAFVLNASRDLGEGILPARKGKAYASRMLNSSPALTVKLLRNQFVAWTLIMFILGAAYGSLFGDIESFLSSSDIMKMIFAADPSIDMTEQFITTLMMVLSMITSVAVLNFVFKLRGEEKKGHLEFLLSNSVSRIKLLLSYTAIAVFSAVVLQFAAAIGMWSAADFVMDKPMALSIYVESGFVYLPAILSFLGLGILLIGLLPRFTSVAWVYLGYTFFAVYVGQLLDIPEWTSKITPVGVTPQIPVEELDIVPLAILTGVFLVMTVVGIANFRKRDLIS